MLTRSLLCSVLMLLVASSLAAGQGKGERPIRGKAPGFLPRRVPVVAEADRGGIPPALEEHFEDIELKEQVRSRENLDEVQKSARAARLIASPLGRSLEPRHRGYYELEARKRQAETAGVATESEDVGDRSWLWVGGGALVLGLGMVWWIRRLL